MATKTQTRKPNRNTQDVDQKSSDSSLVKASPDMAAMLARDSGAGKVNMQPQDFAVPMLKLVQKSSAEVDPTSAYYLESAKPGDLYNTGTRATYPGSTGVLVIFCNLQKHYTEHAPKNGDARGDFIADHGQNAAVIKDLPGWHGTWDMPNGNEIRLAFEYFALVIVGNRPLQVLIPFANTGLKHALALNTLTENDRVPGPGGRSLAAPLFFRSYQLRSQTETSKDGYKWFGWSVKPDKPVLELPNGAELYAVARRFCAATGGAVIEEPNQQALPAGNMPDTANSVTDQDVPF